MYLSIVVCLVDVLPVTNDGMHLCYPLELETQLLSQVQLALTAGKPHRTVENWRTPWAQMNTSSVLDQPHHGPWMRRPVEKHGDHSQSRVEEQFENGLVGLADDHSPWHYATELPGYGYDSLGGLKVQERLSGVVVNVVEYLRAEATPMKWEKSQGKGLLVGGALATEVEALSTTPPVVPMAEAGW